MGKYKIDNNKEIAVERMISAIEPAKISDEMISAIESTKISDKIKNKLISNINYVSKNPDQETLNNMKNAYLIISILTSAMSEHLEEILKGAHVLIEDNGNLYDKLFELGMVKHRISSHHKGNKYDKDASFQAGEIFREFLIGKTQDGKTWFQLEAHSTGGIMNILAHLVDYILYKVTGKNIGQYGYSKNIESNPINIKLDQLKLEQLESDNISLIYNLPKNIEKFKNNTKKSNRDL